MLPLGCATFASGRTVGGREERRVSTDMCAGAEEGRKFGRGNAVALARAGPTRGMGTVGVDRRHGLLQYSVFE